MNLKLIKTLAICYCVVFAYVVYSTIMQTGLSGAVMDWQMRQSGAAYEKPTALGEILVLCIPAFIALKYAQRREQIQESLNPQLAQERAARAQSNVWKTILILGAAPAVISLLAYFYVMHVDRTDQQREIYRVDLSKSDAAPPSADAKFVELTGTYQADYPYILVETRGSTSRKETMYVPLTEPGWNANQPVKYFMIVGFNGYIDPQTQKFSVLPTRGTFAGTFDGTISQDALPTFVRNEYERKGLKIASPHYVLTRTNNFEGGKIKSRADSQMYWLIPVLGFGMSAAILVVGGLGLLIRRARGL